jgi:hypothetical protein
MRFNIFIKRINLKRNVVIIIKSIIRYAISTNLMAFFGNFHLSL